MNPSHVQRPLFGHLIVHCPEQKQKTNKNPGVLCWNTPLLFHVQKLWTLLVKGKMEPRSSLSSLDLYRSKPENPRGADLHASSMHHAQAYHQIALLISDDLQFASQSSLDPLLQSKAQARVEWT